MQSIFFSIFVVSFSENPASMARFLSLGFEFSELPISPFCYSLVLVSYFVIVLCLVVGNYSFFIFLVWHFSSRSLYWYIFFRSWISFFFLGPVCLLMSPTWAFYFHLRNVQLFLSFLYCACIAHLILTTAHILHYSP